MSNVIDIDRGRRSFSQPDESKNTNPPTSPCVPRRITASHAATITRAFHQLRRTTRWLQANNKPLKLVEIENILRDDRDRLEGQMRTVLAENRRLVSQLQSARDELRQMQCAVAWRMAA